MAPVFLTYFKKFSFHSNTLQLIYLNKTKQMRFLAKMKQNNEVSEINFVCLAASRSSPITPSPFTIHRITRCLSTVLCNYSLNAPLTVPHLKLCVNNKTSEHYCFTQKLRFFIQIIRLSIQLLCLRIISRYMQFISHNPQNKM